MYIPNPIQTENIPVPEAVAAVIEKLAENTHEVWAKQRIAEGWSYGPERDDARKETPCLVPYALLPETEKQYDRETSRQTIAVLLAEGYQLVPPAGKD